MPLVLSNARRLFLFRHFTGPEQHFYPQPPILTNTASHCRQVRKRSATVAANPLGSLPLHRRPRFSPFHAEAMQKATSHRTANPGKSSVRTPTPLRFDRHRPRAKDTPQPRPYTSSPENTHLAILNREPSHVITWRLLFPIQYNNERRFERPSRWVSPFGGVT